MVIGPIKTVALSIFVIAGAYTLQIIYSMMDGRQLKHPCKIYYSGTGTKICILYSKYVPGNVNVEVYADDCQIASIYRDNELEITIPPNVRELKFVRRDGTIIGSFSSELIEGKCFYYYSNNSIPIRHNVTMMDDFSNVDDESKRNSYEDVCYEFKLMDLQTLLLGIACSIGPIVFMLLFD